VILFKYRALSVRSNGRVS